MICLEIYFICSTNNKMDYKCPCSQLGCDSWHILCYWEYTPKFKGISCYFNYALNLNTVVMHKCDIKKEMYSAVPMKKITLANHHRPVAYCPSRHCITWRQVHSYSHCSWTLYFMELYHLCGTNIAVNISVIWVVIKTVFTVQKTTWISISTDSSQPFTPQLGPEVQ